MRTRCLTEGGEEGGAGLLERAWGFFLGGFRGKARKLPGVLTGGGGGARWGVRAVCGEKSGVRGSP